MRIILAFFSLPAFVTASLKLMIRDGPVTDTDLVGYIGTSYQAIRYEPLCGTLGTNARFKTPISLSGRCTPSMDAFSNNSADHLAFYDTTGVRLKNAVVGGGTPLCMCFSLSQGGSGGIVGDICIWVDGTAQADVWWSLSLDDILAGDYRPGALKTLPQCAGVDLDGLKATWSATAAQRSVTEAIKTLSNAATAATTQGTTQTKISVSTFTPQVIDYTQVTLLTTTNSQGVLTTASITTSTHLPVVTDTAAPNKEFSESDKIAIGVGLGIGLPTIILMVIAIMQARRAHFF